VCGIVRGIICVVCRIICVVCRMICGEICVIRYVSGGS
jgi:hypothetical protein